MQEGGGRRQRGAGRRESRATWAKLGRRWVQPSILIRVGLPSLSPSVGTAGELRPQLVSTQYFSTKEEETHRWEVVKGSAQRCSGCAGSRYQVLRGAAGFRKCFSQGESVGHGNYPIGERCCYLFLKAHWNIKGLGQRKKEEVFSRKIVILQLVGLVLTYDFTNCDFKKITQDYTLIYNDLNTYMNGTKSTKFNSTVPCYNQSHCLAEIERLTISPTHRCASLAKETFALRTKATLTGYCPDYPGIQINNARVMKKTRKREVTTNTCLEQVSQLLGLWRRLLRFHGTRSKSS
ncbi:thymic stromal lymphopoietin [Carlito syrichta]|uniref:Thymic stromal lymphopoietin n=1 Tax=Carlito syrichta TaxID=1868482 RepID=A0A1U7TS45_CARSF|nr:thymic stromal lymphopoietin [Carlito syrichta]